MHAVLALLLQNLSCIGKNLQKSQFFIDNI